jgi:dolichyl-phosphate beta-glucosyltransferase
MRKTKLTLIIPAYNEERVIKNSLKETISYLSKKKYQWEVIVVDDGSTDETASLVADFASRNKKIKLVKHPKNQGKGAALRTGVLKARGEYIIFSDADLSVSIINIDKFVDVLKKTSEVVISSRRVKGARIIVHQPLVRETMGRVFTWLARMVTGVDVVDFTCGFKGFRRKAALKIFGQSLVDRWAYDSEILFLARKYSCQITQVPVEWRNRGDTRVVLRNVIIESLVDLIKIRLYDLLGRYNGN